MNPITKREIEYIRSGLRLQGLTYQQVAVIAQDQGIAASEDKVYKVVAGGYVKEGDRIKIQALISSLLRDQEPPCPPDWLKVA